MFLLKLLRARRYLAPADEIDANADRGDDFTPTDDDAPTPPPKKEVAKDAPKKEAAKEPGGDDPDGDEDPDKDLTQEEKDAKAAAAKDAPKKGVIPRDRHEKILEAERGKREALERQIASFQGAQVVVKTNEQITARETELAKLDAAYTKALADGETEKAATTMAQIRKLDREISALESESKIAAAEARAVESTRYSIALERVENTYPVLNEDHEDFDADTYGVVVDLMKAYRASGRTPTDALQKAVKVLLGAATASQKAATTVTPRVDPDKASGTDADKVRSERKAGALDKALKAAKDSPATAVAKAGANNDADGAQLTAKEAIKMKHDKFVKLSEDELSRLRGDTVEEEQS